MIVVGAVKTPHLGTVLQVWRLRDEFQVSSLSAQRELGIQDGGAGCSLLYSTRTSLRWCLFLNLMLCFGFEHYLLSLGYRISCVKLMNLLLPSFLGRA